MLFAATIVLAAIGAHGGGAGSVEPPKPPIAVLGIFNLACHARQVPEAKAPAGLQPDVLLAAATRNKPFATSPADAYRMFDDILVSYGLTSPLRDLPRGPERSAMARIAYLVMNDYVVAAQMAYGAAQRSGALAGRLAYITGNMVNTATEPYAGDPELAGIARKIAAADAALQPVSAAPRNFARWAVRGYAFGDVVAIDASLAGFCMSEPSAGDVEALLKAVEIARLERPAPR